MEKLYIFFACLFWGRGVGHTGFGETHQQGEI